MGIFDLFKKKDKRVEQTQESASVLIIPESEKKYNQPDDYYTENSFEGTPFERTVVTFENRKKTAIPSKRGLYPAEILLLDYCAKGSYPGPKNGYPGFWWFAYGIRDVGATLRNLESRGFIELGSAKESVNSFTIPQLKKILEQQNLPFSGKKADLVERIRESVPDSVLISAGVQQKYKLTAMGEDELKENAYVPYMHSVHNKTTEDDRWGMQFNVWSINKLLGSGDKTNWKTIVDAQEQKMNLQTVEKNESFMNDLKNIDPEGYKILKTQDQQIAACQEAQAKYNSDKDLESYIVFWENLWANGGLIFEGASWHFKLPDLYIKAKRYDDALRFCEKLKKIKPSYTDKANLYITKIDGLKVKQAAKK